MASQKRKGKLAVKHEELPPTPPDTEDSASQTSSDDYLTDFPLAPPITQPEVLEIDKKTPDFHVPRDPRLVRLTGAHPFNTEAPLTDLFNEGFLTSPELFYVRNHGPVPDVKDEEIPSWEFSVEGLVENPFTMTLKDMIADYENVTLPVTLVCAGNRRKEQNVVKKTKGFSWGPAGVSTALFTGVYISEVLKKAKPQKRAKYLCMEGAEELPNGKYATSIRLSWAMDDEKGVILAHGMNGERLRPDHGKPLRVVIPGQIGGRSVKWLKKLIITSEPSDNWYHIFDNRVLPTSISPEEAGNDKKLWSDERYAIYDLNNNSAIACPAHDEKLKPSEARKIYTVRGYAYAGGGHRITRAEISIDKAATWRLASIEYPEDRYREAAEDTNLYGGRLDVSWRDTSFCWCFWSLEVPVADLQSSDDILIRTMDDAMAIQPRDMYWSVMGMMNNPWYRVVIHHDEEDLLRFEHPTQPGLIQGGWMERIKKAGGNLSNGRWGEAVGNEELQPLPKEDKAIATKMTNDSVKKEIDFETFKEHESETNPWFVVNGEVYDGTAFLKEHPGGAPSITAVGGQDASDEFLTIHSENAKAMMPEYHVGTLSEEAKKQLGYGPEDDPDAGTREIFLRRKAWSRALLHSKISVSSDTRVFKFKLDHDEQGLGMPTGQHLMIKLQDPKTKENILRPYTPISHESQKGFVDVLVKVYSGTNGGKMTQALDQLPIGYTLEMKGPYGKLEYLGRGTCRMNDSTDRHVDNFFMICGGSGVTPIYQIFRAVMMDEDDPTRCVVLDGNRSFEDILCREDLENFANIKADTAQLVHTLSQPHDGWEGQRGRITPSLIKQHAPKEKNSLALICGPEPMETMVRATLIELGWAEENIVQF